MGIQRICIFRLGAVAMLKDFQHTAKDDSEAAIQALTAGWTWKLPVIAIGLWSN